MKPHPRPPIIRKTIKWGGAVVTVLLVVVWVGSGFCVTSYLYAPNYLYTADHAVEIFAGHGRVALNTTGYSHFAVMEGLGFEAHQWEMAWWLDRETMPGVGSTLYVPIWMLWAPMLIMTAAVWRLDALARRRARIGLCPKCNYDRIGLASKDAVCPECGTAPVSA